MILALAAFVGTVLTGLASAAGGLGAAAAAVLGTLVSLSA